MNFRSDSLFKKLTEEQRDALMLSIFQKRGDDVYQFGADLCKEWGVKTSRSAVHEFYTRYSFSWRLERAKSAAALTCNEEDFEEEKRKLIKQKLFETIASPDVDPKVLILIRSLELEADKIELSHRRVKLLEDNARQAKAKLEGVVKSAKGGLSEKARKEIEEAARLL